MPWKLVEYEFDGFAMSARFSDGASDIEVMANVEIEGRFARLWECHFMGAGANRLGKRRLIALALWLKQRLDVDELRIEGAIRTSGANPGRRPRPLVF